MDRMTGEDAAQAEKDIRAKQKEAGLTDIQASIDSGVVWRMEGAAGREAMNLLESGKCFLPQTKHNDYYGNTVPSRDDLKPGTKGTIELSFQFYQN